MCQSSASVDWVRVVRRQYTPGWVAEVPAKGMRSQAMAVSFFPVSSAVSSMR